VKVKVVQLYLTLCDLIDYSPWNSPGQNTGVGNRFLLQGIFPTQGLNPGLLHCRQILYQLSHQGSLYIYIYTYIYTYTPTPTRIHTISSSSFFFFLLQPAPIYYLEKVLKTFIICKMHHYQ